MAVLLPIDKFYDYLQRKFFYISLEGVTMLDYITKFFLCTPIDLVAKILLILAVSAVYFFIFYYAKKRNLNAFVFIVVGVLAILFGSSFLGVPNLKFYATIVLFIIAFASLVFFSHDFKRDMFNASWRKLFETDSPSALGREDLHKSVSEIIKACQRLSKTETGALIIITDKIADSVLESGVRLNAQISAELLETVFFPKTALHDGAVVICANKVVAASCYLPLTQDNDLPREFGTRHRAAIGVSEAYPGSTTIVVSEETGIISAMHDGKIKRYLDAEQLKRILDCAMRLSDRAEEESIWGLTGYED